MHIAKRTMAEEIAKAASEFEQQRTGLTPEGVTVVLNRDTLVISLRGALSRAELSLAETPAGAVQVQEFHRELFASSCQTMRAEIKKITGAGVREATAEIDTGAGAVVHAFTTGTVVQVFLLDSLITPATWDGPPLEEASPVNSDAVAAVE